MSMAAGYYLCISICMEIVCRYVVFIAHVRSYDKSRYSSRILISGAEDRLCSNKTMARAPGQYVSHPIYVEVVV